MSAVLPPAQAMRTHLRRALAAALRAKDTEVVSALRTAIAAIDDAEAVDPAAYDAGTTEVARRSLSSDDVRAVLRAHVDGFLTEADGYDALGRQDAAARLRRQADVLRGYGP
ncbi:GatB/YqeY domain-containing protein [[Mycobacterium] manitobense]|nr:GatB/YqeY domain-containing protein [[Mycobacterium] manitobense]